MRSTRRLATSNALLLATAHRTRCNWLSSPKTAKTEHGRPGRAGGEVEFGPVSNSGSAWSSGLAPGTAHQAARRRAASPSSSPHATWRTPRRLSFGLEVILTTQTPVVQSLVDNRPTISQAVSHYQYVMIYNRITREQ